MSLKAVLREIFHSCDNISRLMSELNKNNVYKESELKVFIFNGQFRDLNLSQIEKRKLELFFRRQHLLIFGEIIGDNTDDDIVMSPNYELDDLDVQIEFNAIKIENKIKELQEQMTA